MGKSLVQAAARAAPVANLRLPDQAEWCLVVAAEPRRRGRQAPQRLAAVAARAMAATTRAALLELVELVERQRIHAKASLIGARPTRSPTTRRGRPMPTVLGVATCAYSAESFGPRRRRKDARPIQAMTNAAAAGSRLRRAREDR